MIIDKYTDFFKEKLLNWIEKNINARHRETNEKYDRKYFSDFIDKVIMDEYNLSKEKNELTDDLLKNSLHVLQYAAGDIVKWLYNQHHDESVDREKIYDWLNKCMNRAIQLTNNKIKEDELRKDDKVYQMLYQLSDTVIFLEEVEEIDIDFE